MPHVRSLALALVLLSGCPDDPAFVSDDTVATTDTSTDVSEPEVDSVAPDSVAPDSVEDTSDSLAPETTDDATSVTTPETTPETTAPSDTIVGDTAADPDVEVSEACGPGMYDNPGCTCIRADCTFEVPHDQPVSDVAITLRDTVRPVVALTHPTTTNRNVDLVAWSGSMWLVQDDVSSVQSGGKIDLVNDHDGSAIVSHDDVDGDFVVAWEPFSGSWRRNDVPEPCLSVGLAYHRVEERLVIGCVQLAGVAFFQMLEPIATPSQIPASPLGLAADGRRATAWVMAPDGHLAVLAAVPVGDDWDLDVYDEADDFAPRRVATVTAPAQVTVLAVSLAFDPNGAPHVFAVHRDGVSGPTVITHWFDDEGSWVDQRVTTSTIPASTRLMSAPATGDAVYLLAVGDGLTVHTIETGETSPTPAHLPLVRPLGRYDFTSDGGMPWVVFNDDDAAGAVHVWRPQP